MGFRNTPRYTRGAERLEGRGWGRSCLVFPALAVAGTIVAGCPETGDDDTTASPTPVSSNVQPEIEVTPASIDFGEQDLATTANQTLDVGNAGGASLTLFAVDLVGDQGSESFTLDPLALPLTLEPGETVSILAHFTPLEAGAFDAIIEITSNDESQPVVQVPCHGAGVFHPPPDSDADGSPDAEDCAPLDPTIFPGAEETCDGVDNDCDGDIDEGYPDTDGDGTLDCLDPCPTDPGEDLDDDSFCAPSDCDDANPFVNPGQSELCDGVDNNCDGIVDEGFGDTDGDGTLDCLDPCPLDPDDDADGDGFCGDEDLCPAVADDQADTDGDGDGDACDPCPLDPENDADADGHCGDTDNCPGVANPDQADVDGDDTGDACDSETCDGVDNDGDGEIDEGFEDEDADGLADCVDPCAEDPLNDADGDGFCTNADNCPEAPNPDQIDADHDGVGDACDVCPDDPLDDADGDGHCADDDVCPDITDDQSDTDGDGIGDACDLETCDGVDNDGDGEIDEGFPDRDADGAPDCTDPCPDDPGDDSDRDGLCDSGDNCPGTPNATQVDADGDGTGDVCDSCPFDPNDDIDGDLWCADVDNCPSIPNPDQGDIDGDGIGDACAEEVCDGLDNDADGVVDEDFDDSDLDGVADCVDRCPDDPDNDEDQDGVCGDLDNCPSTPNSNQADIDGDGTGDACDAETCDGLDNDGDGLIDEDFDDTDGDSQADCVDPCPLDATNDLDGDGACENIDTCPGLPNPDQLDTDGDGHGDPCDHCPDDPLDDADDDGLCAGEDNCPGQYNSSQQDTDGDGIGDACDVCPTDPLDDADDDGVCDSLDNCLGVANPYQEDFDHDGIGNPCDVEECDGIDNDGNGQTDEGFSDFDEDGIADCVDTCPLYVNPAFWFEPSPTPSPATPTPETPASTPDGGGTATPTSTPDATPSVTPDPGRTPTPEVPTATPAPALETGDLDAPFSTIQAAIDATDDTCSEIWVFPGTYDEHIDFLDRDVRLVGIEGADATVIDGSLEDGPAITIAGNQSDASGVIGFTVTGGSGSTDGQGAWNVTNARAVGGGILVVESDPLIQDNVVTGNHVSGKGGGIYFFRSHSQVLGNLFTHNIASDTDNGGGGVYSYDSTLLVKNNTFLYNSADGSSGDGGGFCLDLSADRITANLFAYNAATNNGAGVRLNAYATAVFDNNLVSNNFGHGVMASHSNSSVILNNTIVGNTVGIYVFICCGSTYAIPTLANNTVAWNEWGVYDNAGIPFTIMFNNIFGNSSGNYGGYLNDYTGVAGNISIDPLLVSYTPDGVMENDDLHINEGSPNVDAGADVRIYGIHEDYDGNPRPVDGRGDGVAQFDIGAYELQ